jgi:hypothetical protein
MKTDDRRLLVYRVALTTLVGVMLLLSAGYWREHQQLVIQRIATKNAQGAEQQRAKEAQQAKDRLGLSQAQMDAQRDQLNRYRNMRGLMERIRPPVINTHYAPLTRQQRGVLRETVEQERNRLRKENLHLKEQACVWAFVASQGGYTREEEYRSAEKAYPISDAERLAASNGVYAWMSTFMFKD